MVRIAGAVLVELGREVTDFQSNILPRDCIR